MKGVPYLNLDPYCQFIGPKNWGKALIDEELMTCLLDNGSQLNFITPAYVHKWGLDITSLDSLTQEVGGKISPIRGIGSIMVDPEGFVMMNVKIPCVKGYNEDQIAIIMDELMTCLLDNGSQLNFITPAYVHKWGLDITSLDSLTQEVGGKIPPIRGIGSIMVDPEGFVMMNVKISCVKGYNEDQIAIVMDDLGMKDCPVILGTPTIFRLMEVIKKSEISKLAIPWASSRVSWLMRGMHAQMSQLAVDDVANKSVGPLSVDEVVRVSHKCKVPPFGHKVIHGSVGLVLQGYRMNVMTHGLEKRSPLLPLRIDVQSAYATSAMGSNRVTVVLRNNT